LSDCNIGIDIRRVDILFRTNIEQQICVALKHFSLTDSDASLCYVSIVAMKPFFIDLNISNILKVNVTAVEKHGQAGNAVPAILVDLQ
jgi:hypothetical protein